jgi:hypothetical protein
MTNRQKIILRTLCLSAAWALFSFGPVAAFISLGWRNFFHGGLVYVAFEIVWDSLICIVLLFFNPDSGGTFQDAGDLWICLAAIFLVFFAVGLAWPGIRTRYFGK